MLNGDTASSGPVSGRPRVPSTSDVRISGSSSKVPVSGPKRHISVARFASPPRERAALVTDGGLGSRVAAPPCRPFRYGAASCLECTEAAAGQLASYRPTAVHSLAISSQSPLTRSIVAL